jgi:hypothetical protein
MSRCRALLICLWLAMSSPVIAAGPTFNRDIRPILSDKCFACHGPDSANQQAGLRLDRFDKATTPVDSGETAIVPGKPDESELWRRITSDDPDVVMPPPSAKLGRLSPEEVETLKRWIAGGAEYQAHWAFLPVEPVPLPVSAPQPDGVVLRSPIDQLVAAGLADEGLTLQPEADKRTLLRRVTYDLTGLPPTPAEIAAFLEDHSPEAYERVVDRLLQSERYGERMAADWLDVARYADSFGFQVDRGWEMWPYRDWVINAFNRNLPWDQFVTWQLAGDLLPNATDEQRLATAFNRLNQQEAEGGSIEEEYRVNYVNDRVVTFGTAFLGLTLECCRCHDHKFDPVTQREYYQFFSFFDDIDEAGLYSYFTGTTPTPVMLLQDDAQKAALAAANEAISTGEARLAALHASQVAAFEAWLATMPDVTGPIPGEIAHYPFESRNEEGKYVSAVDPAQTATSPGENIAVTGPVGQGLKLTGDHAVTTTVGNFPRYEPFTISLWLNTPDVKDRAVVLHRSRAWTDAASRGYELLIEEGRLKWSLIHFWPGDAISIRAKEPLPPNVWRHVVMSYDGSSRAAGLALTVDGRPVEVEIIRDHLTRDITGGGGDTIALGERFRDRGFKEGLVDELRVFNRSLTSAEIQALHAVEAGQPVSKMREGLYELYLHRHDEAYRAQLAELRTLREQQSQLMEGSRDIMVMREMAAPKTAYILKRGEYNLREDAVEPGTPASLPPFPADQPRNRLGLAKWLTEPRHPLLARVTVNRFWQSLFGRGLVKTSEDFGSQAERPRYPELLDWLAGEFVRLNWDVKGFHKTVVLSQTYRQRSFSTARQMTDDPENVALARGPRHRLPAEMIRDGALFACGLLVEKTGGPSVRTYDLPESFKPSAAGTGEQLYRRSLYTYWQRTGPAPMLEAFDVPKRQVCVARRDVTNTPLHAFVLLNGPQFLEAARVLAETLTKAHPDDTPGLLAAAFERLTGRLPDEAEQATLARMYAAQLAWYTAHPEAAAAYLKTGERPVDAALPPIPLAAAANVINALMNYDGAVVKR